MGHVPQEGPVLSPVSTSKLETRDRPIDIIATLKTLTIAALHARLARIALGNSTAR